jgi:phosphatidylinositol dimannoside acyltransferase
VIQRLSFGVLRLLVGIIGLLPGRAARRLGEMGGLIWYVFAGKRRLMARRHMSRVLGDNANLTNATRAVFRSYGRYWAETLWVRPQRIGEVRVGLEIVGLEHLKKAATDGTGVVIALPHLGNWEPAALAGEMAGIEIVAVAERLRNLRLTEWFTSIRRQFGITIVLAGRGSMRAIEESIRRGAAVGLLCDRDLKGRGVDVSFFGETTTLPVGPAALAIRTGAPLLMGACYFTAAGHKLVLEPLTLPVAERRDLREVTQRIAYGLEDMIEAAPEQWHLLQPNWPSDRLAEGRTS